MTSEDADPAAETSAESSTSSSSSSSSTDASASALDPDDSDGSGGLARTLLLAVPLFCKFVIVLIIKFLTDLVVFPLLFLYRVARLTKRRILKMFKSKDDQFKDITPNGS
jgi:hypothetical protein